MIRCFWNGLLWRAAMMEQDSGKGWRYFFRGIVFGNLGIGFVIRRRVATPGPTREGT